MKTSLPALQCSVQFSVCDSHSLCTQRKILLFKFHHIVYVTWPTDPVRVFDSDNLHLLVLALCISLCHLSISTTHYCYIHFCLFPFFFLLLSSLIAPLYKRELYWSCISGYNSVLVNSFSVFPATTILSSSLSLSPNPSFPNRPSLQWLGPWHCVSLTLPDLWAQWLHSQPSSLNPHCQPEGGKEWVMEGGVGQGERRGKKWKW